MRKAGWILSVAAVTGLFAAAIAALLTGLYSFQSIRERFVEETGLVSQSLAARFWELEDIVGNAVLFLHMGSDMGADEFRILAQDTLRRHAYINAVAYFPRVRAAERQHFEALRQKEGLISYRIRDWRTREPVAPAADGSLYPLLYFEPFTPASARLLGLDLLTAAPLSEAANAALASGRDVILRAAGITGPDNEFWLLRATYAGRSLPGAEQERGERAQGLLALRFTPNDMLAAIDVPWRTRCALGLAPLAAKSGIVALSTRSGAQVHKQGVVVGTLARKTSLPIGLNRLILRFERPVGLMELAVLVAGPGVMTGLFSGVLAAMLAGAQWERRRTQVELARHREHLEELVTQRTRELSAANSALEAEIAERRRAEQALQQLAIRDPLTGAYNRREMERQLAEELARSARYRRPLSVLMLDVDHFKAVNDTHGHQVGDEVLRSLASRLRQAVRRADVVARYGGEEFLVILPETTLPQALGLAERIRFDVAQHTMALIHGEALRITVSIGVAAFPDHGADADSLCRSADAALYAAKQSGRNRVEAARAEPYAPISG